MIDIVLLVLVVGYAISGFRQGLVVGVLSLGGFVGGALVAMWAVPSLASGLEAGPQRAVVVLIGVLLVAWVGQFVGALIGNRLKEGVPGGPLAVADHLAGGFAGVVAVCVVMWFVAGAIRGGPTPEVSRAVASSRVLAAIDDVMPQQLVGLADRFRRVVGDSSFPRVFAGVGPETITPIGAPDPAVTGTAAIRRARRSIVKITGEATDCGRGQEGSGAVVAPQRVVTNAHVVAGVDHPRVQVGGVGRKYPATVVAFDPQRDVAVLRVPDLTAPALAEGATLSRGADAVVAGFPKDGPFRAGAARVRSVLNATGENIYGSPGAVRQVYSLYATVQPGNSGGPVLTPAGVLVGVVFAKSLDDASTGYALTLAEAKPVIARGIATNRAVASGGCAVG